MTIGPITFEPPASTTTPTRTPTGTPAPTTITVTDDGTGAAVAGMVVWATSDAAGTSTFAGPEFTSDAGSAVLQLVGGTTYYLNGLKQGETPIVGRPFIAVPD